MIRFHPAIAILAFAIVTPASALAQTAAPDRSTPPPVGPVPPLALPALQPVTLENGLEILVMEKHDVPLVQVIVQLPAGAAADDPARPGLASLTAAMLDEGAAGRSALDIADAFERLGARFATSAGRHVATLSLRVPAARLDSALTLVGDVLLRPDFPDQELDRLRAERLTALIRQRDEPGAIANALYGQTLFGSDHAYGRQAIGSAASLSEFTSADLRAFHETFYKPGSATVVVVGDVDPSSIAERFGSAFGAWPAGTAPPLTIPEVEQFRGRTIFLVDRPGSAQSVVSIGRIGPARDSDDYYALQVLNTVLGGSFTSRLNQNLREDKGYTYGAGSGFTFGLTTGDFNAGAAVQTNATGPALLEFMIELRRITEPIPAEELELAKNFLAMRYPSRFQSVSGLASAVADYVEFGLPVQQLSAYTTNVLAVTGEDVARVAREAVDADNIAIIVVGDRQIVEPQIRALNLGPLRLLDVADVLGPPPGG